MKHPTELVVLAGGFGTRLSSIVPEVPKPLAPVVNRPFLHYLIENWLRQGITTLTFLLHYQTDLIRAFLEQERRKGLLTKCEIHSVTEPHPLGTGGAVAHAVQKRGLTRSFMVTNADTWLGSGIGQVLNTATPALSVVRAENSERYGSLRIEQDRVVAFREKQQSSGPGWINAGLYHLQPEFFRDWDGMPFSLERGLFPKLAATGQLRAVPLETDFIDIGIPEDYIRFCRWVESDKMRVL